MQDKSINEPRESCSKLQKRGAVRGVSKVNWISINHDTQTWPTLSVFPICNFSPQRGKWWHIVRTPLTMPLIRHVNNGQRHSSCWSICTPNMSCFMAQWWREMIARDKLDTFRITLADLMSAACGLIGEMMGFHARWEMAGWNTQINKWQVEREKCRLGGEKRKCVHKILSRAHSSCW